MKEFIVSTSKKIFGEIPNYELNDKMPTGEKLKAVMYKIKESIKRVFSRVKTVHLIIFAAVLLAAGFGVYVYQRPGPSNQMNTTIVKATGAYAYQNTTNEFQTQFKENPTDAKSIVFSNKLGNISFYTPADQSFGKINSNNPPVADGSTLTYPEIFPGIDLKYTISSSRLLEEFIVQDATVAGQISRIEQRAQTKNTYVANDDGSITFYNKDKEVFTLPHPVMYETGDPTQKSEGIVYEIKPDGDQLIITKVITEEGRSWLADPQRLYPIAIDLVIDNADDISGNYLIIDGADTVGNWTSSDTTFTPITQETSLKQEGTGSVKVQTNSTGSVSTTVDLLEYSSDGTAQAGYTTNSLTSATGGTITTSGGYTIHTFTSSGTFTPNGGGNVEYLVVAGGAGGASAPACSGGGRGGQVSTGSLNLSTGNHTVTIGGGGSGGGGTGGNSVFSSITATGGTYPSGMGGDLSVPAGGTYSSINGTNTLYGIFGASTTFYGGGWNCSGDSGGPYSGYGTTGVANTGGGGSSGDGKGDCAGVSLSCPGWSGGSGIVIVRYLTPPYLQSYSEATIKTQGTYALKGVANQTTSLNKTLTHTIGSPVNLSNYAAATFDLRASRTGSNIKIGLRDSGGTTTEVTPNITSANAFQSVTLDLSGVTNANKDAIDQIIITIVNADATNTFYLDNLTATGNSLNNTITRTISPISLSVATSITYWVRSSVAGSYATFGFGESAATEQTNAITISQANTWEQKTWDISGIAGSARDAVTKIAFTFTGDTSGAAFYFDDIRANGSFGSWISSDSSATTVSLESSIKQEGSGSVKVQTTAGGAPVDVDLMEYSSNGTAQAAFVTNSATANGTGGTITSSGGYTIHKFTSSGTFTPPTAMNVEALVVAGGGGGGANSNTQPGGGGGGGYRADTAFAVTPQAYTVTVGTGGNGGVAFTASPTVGGNSTFSTITSSGGGTGSTVGYPVAWNAASTGGSGGGGGGGTLAGGGGTGGQGNNGGTTSNSYPFNGSGGGGSGGAGGSNTGGETNKAGGAGTSNSISGSAVTYAAGGTGAVSSTVNGGDNTGNGGSGGTTAGGNGGSGIVIVRYIPPTNLQSYSEATIKTQGTYALKGVANITTSLNKTLTRTIASPLNLSNSNSATFDIRASRTGSNIKVGLHDSGGTTTEVTPNITSANTFQSATIDLSGVTNANKDAIDQIIITIVNADATNTFYLDNMVAAVSSSLNDTVTRTTASTDLSGVANITYWVRSSVAGSYATFGFGETAATEQTNTITINEANTWEQKSWNIESISAASRNAVTKFAFTFTGDTSGAAFYFDDIQTNALFAPTLGTATGLTDTSIRWNFTDNSSEETGFKVYDADSNLLVTCASTNLTYCDETGLTINTQYTRKIGTYNASSTSIASGTVSGYTLAAVPSAPVVTSRDATTVSVNPDPGTNSAATEMAIYREEGSTCDGTGGVYLAAGGGSNGDTAVWQTDTTWGTVTASGLTSEKAYVFCVKAKNGDSVETAFSAVGSHNAGFIPLSGNYICAQDTVNSSTFTNRYVDGSNPARYVIALDSGTGTTNNAVFEAKSCIMTLNSTDTLVTGSLELTGGSIAIATGGQIKIASPVWAIDADADGYTSDTKLYYGDQPVGGVRKNAITTLATADCGDSTYSTSNFCCTANSGSCTSDGACCSSICGTDADGDNYFSSVIGHSGTCQATSKPYTDCNDTGTNAANVYVSATCYADADNDNYGTGTAKSCTNNATCDSATWASGGAGTAATSGNFAANNTDCNDASASLYRSVAGYLDNDGDGYGAGAYTTCAGASGSYVASGADCYDANANAKPGSGVCSATNRGDGSYDYNCSGSSTGCSSTYYSANDQPYYYCKRSGCAFGDYYASCIGSPVGCGQGGYLGSGWSTYQNCESCTGMGPYGCTARGAYGTQACQ